MTRNRPATAQQPTDAGSPPPDDPPVEPGSAGRAWRVDRLLCSNVWLSPRSARNVYGELVRPGLSAIEPAFGIDLVALARHAGAAYRHDVRVAIALTVDLLAVLLGVPTLLIVLAGSGWQVALLGGLLLILAGALFAVGLMVWDLGRCHTRATAVLDDTADPRQTAPALDPATERRLAEADRANAVVFRGGNPFAGAGACLDSWHLSVDTAKAATDSTGKPRKVSPVDAVDLHRELTNAIRRTGADLRVHNRLFVGGEAVGTVPGLLPDRFAPPRSVVARDVLRSRIEHPDEDARTYLCVEKSSWGGELVVNLFVRAALVGSDLFVEFHAYVLLPLRSGVCRAENLGRSRASRFWTVTRSTLPDLRRRIRYLPGLWWDLLRWRWRLGRRLSADRRRVRLGRRFSYGPRTSIRQEVAATERIWLFAHKDEEMYVDALQRRVLDVISRVLEDHGIDTSDFKRQQTVIVNQSSFRIGKVTAEQIMIGDANQMIVDSDPVGTAGNASGAAAGGGGQPAQVQP